MKKFHTSYNEQLFSEQQFKHVFKQLTTRCAISAVNLIPIDK